MNPSRRRVLTLAGAALAAPAIITRAAAAGAGSGVQAAVDRFAGVAEKASVRIVAGYPDAIWQFSHMPTERMFIGSAFKTFVLAQFLRDVEAGKADEDAQMTIDDAVRSPDSPVFLDLNGTTRARSVLEAMITHSDNTATDVTLGKVTPAAVRALIAEAGLKNAQIPDSTRMLVSYISGAAAGVDIGWDGIKAMENGKSFGPPHPALNDAVTMASTADELVAWYQKALAGVYFTKPGTLVEFKRIQAMADAIARIVPPDTVAFAKGGSIDWEGFHALCVAGQMIVGGVPITFCATINWNGPDDGVGAVQQSYAAAAADLLQAAAEAVG